MRRNLIWVILVILFLLEGSLIHWLIPAQLAVRVAPHLVLTAVVFIALYLNRHSALLYGLLIGLLQDIIYYGHMIGLYSFCMGLIGYFVGLAFHRAKVNIVAALCVVAMASLFYEMMIYGLYRLFNIIEVSLGWVFMRQMLPSLLITVLFALIIYVPARKFLERLNMDHKKDENEE